MAPKSIIICNEEQNLVKKNLLCKQDQTPEKPRDSSVSAMKRSLQLDDRNERSRKIIKNCFSHLESNLNVLVIGSKEAGKSSLINSMSMALTQEWTDKAHYCPGKKHVIDPCVVFQSRKSEKELTDGRVIFWDTRGFEDIHCDDQAILILRYILEGRIPPKCIPCVLLMPTELIKKRYHKTPTDNRRIDLVLNVAALDQAPQTRLMSLIRQAISSSKQPSINRVPLVSVATKSDVLTESEIKFKMEHLHEYSLEHVVQKRRDLNRSFHRKRPATVPDVLSDIKLVVNYNCELEPWSDESVDPSSVLPSADLDTQLLAIWREIVTRTACGGRNQRKRAYSAADSSNPLWQCLPFRNHHSRGRSASF